MKDNSRKKFDVIIVGAGPAGLGIGIILQKLGIDYIVLEKNTVGASFQKWPKETRFISPSFTGNFFNMPDLNAITPDTSPAFSLLTEHPTGAEYATYLKEVSDFYQVAIQNHIEVQEVQKNQGAFTLNTSNGTYTSTVLVWAGGEFQYPKTDAFKGDHLCTHYSTISSFSDLEGKEMIVIGAYESGFDAAVNLTKRGKKVTLLDRSNNWGLVNSDSSYSLSPFTRDRVRNAMERIAYHKKTLVKAVTFENGTYTVKTSKFKKFTSKHKPINCTGFTSSLSLVQDLFDFENGYPLLDDFDESTATKNLFLAGPQVKHKNALFCFIYKYRQRFAIVAERIAKQKKISRKKIQQIIQPYKDNNFYLDDLSCCDDECAC